MAEVLDSAVILRSVTWCFVNRDAILDMRLIGLQAIGTLSRYTSGIDVVTVCCWAKARSCLIVQTRLLILATKEDCFLV